MPTTPPPATGLLCVCAWCGRWRDAAGKWQAPPATPQPNATITHGICPTCVAAQTADETPPGPLPWPVR